MPSHGSRKSLNYVHRTTQSKRRTFSNTTAPAPVQTESTPAYRHQRYQGKVRSTRTKGQSYKAASRTLKGIQQQERSANQTIRASLAALAAHHHESGSILDSIAHAASSAGHTALSTAE